MKKYIFPELIQPIQMIRYLLSFLIGSCFILLHTEAKEYDVRDFGAVSDGVTVNTIAIQKAIDLCSEEGGGEVLLRGGGRFISGTIYLRDNVTLFVGNGTTLAGSTNINDYTTDTYKNMYKGEAHLDRCFIFARDAKSIAIKGNGIIDGNGKRSDSIFIHERPMLIRFLNCTGIHLSDLTLTNPASWTTAFLYCDDITVTGLTINSQVNWNNDGLDFDGCTNVRVSNCILYCTDDCICLQASDPEKPCRDVVISNCFMTSHWDGIRIGLLSRGDISSVTVTNCLFRNMGAEGIKIQLMEGGEMKNMVFSNLVMEDVSRPVFVIFCQQHASVDAPAEFAPMKAMHHFIFENILVDNSRMDKNSVFFFSGMPEKMIEDVLISNVHFIVAGGGTKEDAAKKVKEFTPDVVGYWWPEFYTIGTLPAYGLYARHINGLHIEGFTVEKLSPDERPAAVFENVGNHGILQFNPADFIINGKRKRR